MVSGVYQPIVALAEIADDEKKKPHSSDIRNYELGFTKTLPPTVMDRLSIYQSELLSKTGAFRPPSEGQPSPYPDLFQVLNTNRTNIGAATILRSILQPLTSISLIEAKQESLKELESWPDLEKYLLSFVEALAKDIRLMELLFSARNPGSRVNITRLMRKITSYFHLIVASSKALPNPESPYLRGLLQQIRAIPTMVAGKLILGGMYVTWGGKALAKSEAKWHQHIHKYVPYPITGKISIPASILASCALFPTSPNIKSLLGLISVPMLFSAMAIAFGRSESDYQNAFVPLSRRCIEDTDFLLAIDAIGKIEELLAFREFKRRIPYQTSLPTFLIDRPYTLNANGFLNPVMAATDGDLVANDIEVNAVKPSVLTGFNSSAKTSTGQGLVFNQILAQIGCYVVASKAELSCASRIYYQGHRTAHGAEGEFGTDLTVTRDIVFAATPADLVVLDEPCRGTSQAENSQLGMRILRALAIKGVTTFVTTHNLSMVEHLSEEGIINPLMIEIREDKATYRIVPGIATSSGAEQIAKRIGFSNEDVDTHLRNNLT